MVLFWLKLNIPLSVYVPRKKTHTHAVIDGRCVVAIWIPDLVVKKKKLSVRQQLTHTLLKGSNLEKNKAWYCIFISGLVVMPLFIVKKIKEACMCGAKFKPNRHLGSYVG
jgi:hypothetical protein